MAKQLDVYRDWLGIAETARPLDYYQLLRLKTFEDDSVKVRGHYRKMNAHVRKFASGDYARQSQDLLNELAKAMLCLTDVQRKREYDATLGRQDTDEGRRRSLEEILLAGKAIDRGQLAKARSYADAVGLEVRDALVQQKMASAEVVTAAYAESQGLPYIELADVGVEAELVPQIPAQIARQHSCVPLMIDQGQLLMASPNPLLPDVEEELRLRFNMPVRTILCTASSIHAVVAECYPRESSAAEPAAAKKTPRRPKAAKPKPQRQKVYRTGEENLRRRLMFSVVAFNVVVMLYMIYRVMTYEGFLIDFPTFSAAAIAVFLGLVAGGVTFAIMTWKDL